MTALVLAILAASLLGSLHCAGMCGAFLAIAVAGDNRSVKRDVAIQSAYHLGRLVSYVLLGAAAGAAGHFLNLTAALAGVRPVAAALAGAMMIAFGVTAYLRTRGMSMARLPLPASFTRLAHKAHGAAMRHPPVTRAAAIGLLTTLLPCGWLYAFAVTAAGTGSAVSGALVMGVFWVGTLPVLVALGSGVQRLAGAIGRRLPALTSLALVGVGLYTLAGRLSLDPEALARRLQPESTAMAADATVVPTPSTKPCCIHDARR